MGLDFDFEDRGVIRAREGSERLAACRTALLVGGQGEEFLGGWQVAVVAAAVSRVAALLSAWPSAAAVGRSRVGMGVGGRRGAVAGGGRGGIRGSRRRGELIGAWSCFRAAAKVLLAEESELGFEFGEALAERVLALAGTLMHCFPVADLLSEREAFGV